MNVQTPITPAMRLRFEMLPVVPVESPAWPPELPVARIEPRPSRSRRRAKPRAEAVLPLSARARAVLIRRLSARGQWLAKSSPCEQRLLRIAARCSRADLQAQRGVGPAIVEEIQAWLTMRGKEFRQGPASPETALAQAIGLIEAMVEGADQDAFLTAFNALPELRRSLGLAA